MNTKSDMALASTAFLLHARRLPHFLGAILFALLAACPSGLQAVVTGSDLQPAKYAGESGIDRNRPDGALRPYVGVHNFQVLRANRSNLAEGNRYGFTLNHGTDLAYWNGKLWNEYGINRINEAWLSQTDMSTWIGLGVKSNRMFTTSSDGGRTWNAPKFLWDFYRDPATGKYAELGARNAWYVASNGRLLASTSQGIGIDGAASGAAGRVVREVYANETLGPVYYVRDYPLDPDVPAKRIYPFYTTSADAGFVAACNEMLADKVHTETWNEDEIGGQGNYGEAAQPTDGFYKVNYGGLVRKAFSTARRPDGSILGVWKFSFIAQSFNNGQSWSTPVFEPSLVMKGGRNWVHPLADGRLAMVYQPHADDIRRWPLAMTLSSDGKSFDELGLIHGDVSPMRFRGTFKSWGPSYQRGLAEATGLAASGNDRWVGYSMNKEDLWISRIPASPVLRVASAVNDNFNATAPGAVIPNWNIYSGTWAPVQTADFPSASNRSLELQDRDPHNYARAVRVFPESTGVVAEFKVNPRQTGTGTLEIDVVDAAGARPVRIAFTSANQITAQNGATVTNLQGYTANTWYTIRVTASCATSQFTVAVNGTNRITNASFAESAASLERVSFRTGPFPTTPNGASGYTTADLASPDTAVTNAIYNIDDFLTLADTFNPRIVSATPDGADKLVVQFNEPLEAASAGNAANYQVNGISITSAAFNASKNRVVLSLGAAPTPGTPYTLTVSNVRDTSANSITAATAVNFTVPTGVPTSGLKIWTRADAGVTLTAGKVSQWTDQSGSSNHLVMPDAARQPSLVSNVLNGRPAIRFAGAQCLQRDVDNLIGERFSIFAVKKASKPASSTMFLDTGNDGEQSRHTIWAGANYLLYTGGGEIQTDQFNDGDYLIYGLIANQSNSSARINGVPYVGHTSTTASGSYTELPAPNKRPLVLGSRYTKNQYFWSGDVMEFIVYDRALSPSETAQVEAYLRARYFPPVANQVAAPTFTPAPGTYASAQNVTLTELRTGS